jgi:hypothetical protein
MLDGRLTSFDNIQRYLLDIYNFLSESNTDWIPSEALSLSGFSADKIKDDILYHISNLASCSNYNILVDNCVSILSLNYKWYRHQDVSGVSFGDIVCSVLNNKEDSRPLGSRPLTVSIEKDYIGCPDDWRINVVYLYTAAIFQRGGSHTRFDSDGKLLNTSNLGATNTRIKISLGRSYWSQYLTYIFTVLNFNKLDSLSDVKSDRKSKKEIPFSQSSGSKRMFSTHTRSNKTYIVYDTLVGLPFDIVYKILTSIPEKP